MLAKTQRLRTDRDYSGVFRRSRLVRGRALTVRVAFSEAKADRYGFIISTKVSKRATVRNLIKRRLRTAARAIKLPAHKPIDVAVTAMPPSVSAPYSALFDELHQLVSSTLYAPTRRRPD